jgi:hypothetical protein
MDAQGNIITSVKNQSPRRMLRQESPRRFVRKSYPAEDEFAFGTRGEDRQPIVAAYTTVPKFDLVVDDKTVQRIMGPDPIPQIDIEYGEIQNELQKKLVEEI